MKTKIVLFALTGLLLFNLVSGNVFAQTPDEPLGEGTEASPYEIATWQNLYWVSQNTDEWGKHYLQTQHIDFTDSVPAITTWNSNTGWTPIGNNSTRFTGTYDGDGYTIGGLFIYRPTENYQGLFGYIDEGSTIKNLDLIDVEITGNGQVGGLAGSINESTATNNYTSGTVIGSDTKIGGLVGRNYGGTLSESYFMGQVSGTAEVGGLVGENDNDGTISNSYTTGTVSGTGYDVGGMVGVNQSGEISDSYSTSEVNGNRLVGGLVGYFFNGTINRCYATNEVIGNEDGIGGLVGNIYSGSVNNSYATGAVTGNTQIGGLVGYISYNSGSVNNSYATGTVSGNTKIGGLVGENNGSVSNSFWDIDTSELSESAGGTGKTTRAMQNIATYNDTATEGLDAEWPIVIGWVAPTTEIWGICGGVNRNYPFLLWMFDKNPCVIPWELFLPAIFEKKERDTTSLGR